MATWAAISPCTSTLKSSWYSPVLTCKPAVINRLDKCLFKGPYAAFFDLMISTSFSLLFLFLKVFLSHLQATVSPFPLYSACPSFTPLPSLSVCLYLPLSQFQYVCLSTFHYTHNYFLPSQHQFNGKRCQQLFSSLYTTPARKQKQNKTTTTTKRKKKGKKTTHPDRKLLEFTLILVRTLVETPVKHNFSLRPVKHNFSLRPVKQKFSLRPVKHNYSLRLSADDLCVA